MAKEEKKNTAKKVEKKEIKKIVKEKVVDEVEKEDTKNEKTRFNLSSTKKEENRRLFILLGFVGVMIAIVIIATIISNVNSTKAIEELKTYISKEGNTAIYVMKDGCQYCTLNESNINEMKETYGADFYTINLASVDEKDQSELATILNVDELSTPTLAIVGDGEVKDKLEGVTRFDTLFNYLKNHSIISKDSKLDLNYIDYANYKKLIKSKDNQIIVLAASTCHYCLSEHPILEQIVREYNVKINYMYMDSEFGTQDDADKYKEFQGTLSWFADNEWGTPTMLIVNDSKVVTSLNGYYDYDGVVSFLKDNGMIG